MSEFLEIEVDAPELGSYQLRDCLRLSLLSGQPFRISGLVGVNSQKPGIRREDVIAIDLAASVGKARVDGARTASTEVAFWPTGIYSGNYTFSVGSAGKALDLLQLVALPLCFGFNSSVVTVFGVTHGSDCPSYEFFESGYVGGVLRAGGLRAKPTLHHAGYSPLGVGKASLSVEGSQLLRRFHLPEPGCLFQKRARLVSGERDAEVRARLGEQCATALSLDQSNFEVTPRPNGPDTSNSITVYVENEFITEIFSSCCEDGEDVVTLVEEVAKKVTTYLHSGATVSPLLAGHLSTLMAAAGGGSFTTYNLGPRAETTLHLLDRFLPVTLTRTKNQAGNTVVEIKER
jgi:RNA 3'-terminal phosphate cyclase (ATP)